MFLIELVSYCCTCVMKSHSHTRPGETNVRFVSTALLSGESNNDYGVFTFRFTNLHVPQNRSMSREHISLPIAYLIEN